MAEVIDAAKWPPTNRQSKYPWSTWFDGQAWKLERGVDFDVSPGTFRSAVAMAAGRRELRVRTRTVGDVVYVQRL